MHALALALVLSAPPIDSTWTYRYDATPITWLKARMDADPDVFTVVTFRKAEAQVTVKRVDGEGPSILEVLVTNAPAPWREKPWLVTANENGEPILRTGLDEGGPSDELLVKLRRLFAPLARDLPLPDFETPCSQASLDAVAAAATNVTRAMTGPEGTFSNVTASCMKANKGPQRYTVSYRYEGSTGENHVVELPFKGTASWAPGAWTPSLSVSAKVKTKPGTPRPVVERNGTVKLTMSLQRR